MSDRMKRPASKLGGFSCVEDAARSLQEENMAIKQDIQNLRRKLELKIQEEEEQNQTINELRVYNNHLRQRRQEQAENRQTMEEALGSSAQMLELTKAALDHAHQVRDVTMNQIGNCEKWRNTTTDRLTTILQALEQQVSETQCRLETSRQNKQAEEEKSARIQEEIFSLKEAHDDALVQAESKYNNLVAEEVEFKSTLQASKARVDALTIKKHSTDQDLSCLRESVGLVKEDVQTWEQKCIQLDEEAARAEDRLELSKQRTAMLEKELAELGWKASQSETQVALLQKENDELEAKMAAEEHTFRITISALKAQKENLVKQRHDMDVKVTAVREEVTEMRNRNLELMTKVTELQNAIEASNKELISKKSEMKDTEHRLVYLTDKMQDLPVKSSEQEVELQFRSQKLKIKEEELAELNARIIALEASNSEKEKQMESILAEIDRNNTEEKDMDLISASLKCELAAQEDILQKLLSENNVINQKQVDDLKLKIATVERLRSELVDLKSQAVNSEEMKLKIKAELRTEGDRIRELETDLQALKDRIQVEVAAIHSDKSVLAEKRANEIQSLEEELELKRKELEEKKTTLSKVKASHNEKVRLTEQPFSETLQMLEVTTEEATLKATEALQKVEELEFKLSSLQDLQTTLLAQKQDVFDKRYALQTELQRKNADLEGLQQQDEAFKKLRTQELEAAEAQMSNELINLDSQIQALLSNNDTTRTKLSSRENEVATLKKSYSEASSKFEEEKRKNVELQEALKEVNEASEKLEIELSAAADEETRVRSEAVKLSKTLEEVQGEVSNLKQSKKGKEAECVRKTNEMNQMEKSIKTLAKEIIQVTTQLMSAQKVADDLTAENKKFEAEMELLMKVNKTKSEPQSTSRVANKRSLPSAAGTVAARQGSPLKKISQVYSRRGTASAVDKNEPRQSQNQHISMPKPRMTSTPIHSIDLDFSLTSLLGDSPPRGSSNNNVVRGMANPCKRTDEKDEVNKKNGTSGPTRFRRF